MYATTRMAEVPWHNILLTPHEVSTTRDKRTQTHCPRSVTLVSRRLCVLFPRLNTSFPQPYTSFPRTCTKHSATCPGQVNSVYKALEDFPFDKDNSARGKEEVHSASCEVAQDKGEKEKDKRQPFCG